MARVDNPVDVERSCPGEDFDANVEHRSDRSEHRESGSAEVAVLDPGDDCSGNARPVRQLLLGHLATQARQLDEAAEGEIVHRRKRDHGRLPAGLQNMCSIS
jgi:hypothetical protein